MQYQSVWLGMIQEDSWCGQTGPDEIVGTRVFSEKAMRVDQCCSILLNMYISSAPDKKR